MTNTYVISASGKATILKGPKAKLDYVWDWAAWLTDISDTILSHLITVESGITLDSSAIMASAVVAVISGGTVGATNKATCRITTVGGRIEEHSIYIKIVER